MCGHEAILAYLGAFFAPVGSHLGLSGSGKLVKLLSMDVLNAIPTLPQPVSLNIGFHMAKIVIMLDLALFWAFWGTFKGLNMKNARLLSWSGGQYTEWDQKNHR